MLFRCCFVCLDVLSIPLHPSSSAPAASARQPAWRYRSAVVVVVVCMFVCLFGRSLYPSSSAAAAPVIQPAWRYRSAVVVVCMFVCLFNHSLYPSSSAAAAPVIQPAWRYRSAVVIVVVCLVVLSIPLHLLLHPHSGSLRGGTARRDTFSPCRSWTGEMRD